MNTFELDYRKFERLPQRQQLSTIFNSTIEEVFETLETAGLYMLTDHFMIEPIFNLNFGNTIHHQNGTNPQQQIQKH